MPAPDRPVVGVSACLLGQPLRYDGRDKRAPWLVDVLAARADLVPLCPEADAGLGVPREPLRLERVLDGLRVRTAESRTDCTAKLDDWIRARLDGLGELDGCVLKTGSPSCGTAGVPVHDDQGRIVEAGAGVFARALGARSPDLPLATEEDLDDVTRRRAFLGEVFSRRAGRQAEGLVRPVTPDEIDAWCACPRRPGDARYEAWVEGERTWVADHHATDPALFVFERGGTLLGKYDVPFREPRAWTLYAPHVRRGANAEAIMTALCRHVAARSRWAGIQRVEVLLEDGHPDPDLAHAGLVAAGFESKERKLVFLRSLAELLPAVPASGVHVASASTVELEGLGRLAAEAGAPDVAHDPGRDPRWQSMGVVIVEHGVPLGLALPDIDGEAASFHFIGILPRARGRGLGRVLFRAGLDALARGGVAQYIGSTAVDNEPMRRLFAWAGCREIARRSVYGLEVEGRDWA